MDAEIMAAELTQLVEPFNRKVVVNDVYSRIFIRHTLYLSIYNKIEDNFGSFSFKYYISYPSCYVYFKITENFFNFEFRFMN